MAKIETIGKMVEFDRLAALVAEGKQAEFSPEEHIFYREELLKKWETAQNELARLKESEMDFRKQVVKFSFNTEQLKGTERIPLENGYELKAVKKLNYNVNQDTVNDCLDELENLDEKGKFLSERIIKWKADLSVTEYNDLDEKYKKIIDKCITTSEGAPTLEIVAPKGTKRK